jgi:exodeoxyribonuclease-3
MRIATWNVNSVKARLPNVLAWLQSAAPDVCLLQELKCVTEAFPALEIEALGYNLAVHGQKTYNGVAILSKRPIEDVTTGLPGDPSDEQARYIEATISGVRIASIYLPNGNPVDSPKFPYKLGFFTRLLARTKALLAQEETFVLGGDYNVCPTDADVYDPKGWANDALCRSESRAAFRTMLNLGLTDAYRSLHPDQERAWTFWDYQAGAWPRDHGLRIDHLLLSPQAADRLQACEIDREPRGREKASDHTPVWCELAEA